MILLNPLVRISLLDGTVLERRRFSGRQPQLGDRIYALDGSTLVVRKRTCRWVTGFVEAIVCERLAARVSAES